MAIWYRIEHSGNTHYFNKDRISSVEVHPTAPPGISEAQPWYAVRFYSGSPEPIAELIFDELVEASELVARFLADDKIY